MRTSRIGIVGGSVSGCLAALVLRRAGCAVTVFERSAESLRERGSGIGMPLPLRERLIGAGWVGEELRSFHCGRRLWSVRDGDEPLGRVIWRQELALSTNNWGVLWRALRAGVPDADYRGGVTVRRIEFPDARASLDGEEFDLILGADGYRSAVRAVMHPGSSPRYAGYVLWRGNYDARLAPPDALDALAAGNAATVCFPGGHLMCYLVPGRRPGDRVVNWAFYGTPPEGTSFADPTSLPPGSLGPALTERFERLVDEHLPPSWARTVRATPAGTLSLQPIYDHTVPGYVSGRAALLGDAATLARPHTGSGVDKAAADVFALADLAHAYPDFSDVLRRYDAQRRPVGDALVEFGRRLGYAQVEHTPDWSRVDEEWLRGWAVDILAGQRNFMYQDAK